MNARRLLARLALSALCLVASSPVFGLANRVFVSARSGNDANACDNIATPCQTFAGAVSQLNTGGEVIVLDSGGYGPVTITKGLTIDAPAGVTAFIHPPSGDAIFVNAGSATVVLRGLVLNSGPNNGISVVGVGTLVVDHCTISGFLNGIDVYDPGALHVENTTIQNCSVNAIYVGVSTGAQSVWIDHCHLDNNGNAYQAASASPGSSMTMATNSTANGNFTGWICGNAASSGKDLLNIDSCTASGNGGDGLFSDSGNAASAMRFSNSVIIDNGAVGVGQAGAGTVVSRGNNTITGNVGGPTSGTVGTFSPM